MEAIQKTFWFLLKHSHSRTWSSQGAPQSNSVVHLLQEKAKKSSDPLSDANAATLRVGLVDVGSGE
jgi:ribosomal protein S16